MRKGKRFFKAFVLAAAFCAMSTVPCTSHASAVDVPRAASDNTFATASRISMGNTLNGSITETKDYNNYQFQLDSAGCISLNMTAYMKNYCIRIYETDGTEVWYTDENYWNETVGYRRDEYNIYLEKGTYYIQINGYAYRTYQKSTGEYTCRTSFTSSGVTNREDDNSFADANNIAIGDKIVGQISVNDDFDTYKFTLSQVGCVKLDMTSYMQYYCIKLFNSDGEEIWYTSENEWTSTVGYRSDSYDLYLEKGTYYMQINGYDWGTYYKSTGKYVCNTSFTGSGVSFDGDDNDFKTAKQISWNKKYIGQISENDDFDNYIFSVPKDQTIAIDITSYMRYYCIRIFDSDGKEIWETDDNEWNSNVGYRKDSQNIVLSAGKYYMQINGYAWGKSYKSTGKYVFSVSSLSQANCNHDYSSKWVDATYFEKGYRLYTCEKCGKKYKDDYVAKRQLDQGSISSWYSSSGKGKIYLRWYTISDASGYQIRYCKKKSMKSGVKVMTVKGQRKYKKTISKLSRRKRYYVQVRAYKKSGKKTVYGKWSQKYMLKTK